MALMEGQERRAAILKILEEQQQPISGNALAKQLQVSRQVIVQDMALLRAANVNIISTTKGYILFLTGTHFKRRFTVSHQPDEIQEELNLMVDAGGKVLDVVVSHPIYGDISVELVLNNRKEVKEFLKKTKEEQSAPLMNMANGVHAHTVEAESQEILDEIQQQLEEQGYLISVKKINE